MEGEAVFEFNCGSSTQAAEVADWLECENWPDELRSRLEATFGDLSGLASIVFAADEICRGVRVRATGLSSLEMLTMVLDYAMQKWRSVPSPQGFTFGLRIEPKIDPETYETLDPGEYDGGAVVLRRGAEPEVLTASTWLETVLRGAKSGQ